MDDPRTDAALLRARKLVQKGDTFDISRGYVDTVGSTPPRITTPAQLAMHNPLVASIYENLWRPTIVSALGIFSMSTAEERAKATKDLALASGDGAGAKNVLDVASGPGNFTKYLSDQLDGDGVALGFDISEPMLARAVRDNRGPRAAYVRGDARTLPFADDTFDAVCCYAALYLMPNPFTIVDELIRVLKPGGRIAVMTSYRRQFLPVRAVVTVGAALSGIRMFDKSSIPAFFTRAGLTDVVQQIHGFAQFVSAAKPS